MGAPDYGTRDNKTKEVRTASSAVCLKDLVEDAAVVKMRLLRLLPIPPNFSQGEKFHFWELPGVFGEGVLVLRTKIVFGGYLLAFRAIKIFQVSFGHGLSTVTPSIPVYPTH